MTTELYLLRHAHAGDPAKWHGADFDRPLSARGREQASRLGVFLAATGFAPDAIVTSPRIRALQTAELVAERLGATWRVDDRLADPLSTGVLERILTDAGDPSRPVLVGHDPDFSELVGLLTGASRIAMRKGSLARIDVERPLAWGEGALRWLLPPELIPDVGRAG
jgi:phosphohistidine phosphatase